MKTKYSFMFLVGAFLFNHHMAYAEIEEDGRLWLNVNARGSLPLEGFNWYAELQPRWREEGEDLDQLLIRPAVFYQLSSKSSVWLGYANVNSYPAGRNSNNEDRLWQQFSYQFDPIADIAISSRTRFEQRWFDNSSDTGYRLRQMIKLSRPIASLPNLSWVVSDEYFFNTNDTDWGAHSGFDQNRLFVGAGYKIHPTAKVEMGYLNQYLNGVRVDRMNHALSTTLEWSF